MSSSLSMSAQPVKPVATAATPEGRSPSLSEIGRHDAVGRGRVTKSGSHRLPHTTPADTELEPHWAAAIEAATD